MARSPKLPPVAQDELEHEQLSLFASRRTTEEIDSISPKIETKSTTRSKKHVNYSAADIQVLEGIAAIRHRPGMYIGSTSASGLLHLVWEALDNAVVHGNQENPERKVRIRCRCQPGNEISIVVTDQGEGFDFETILRNGITLDPGSEHGRGLQLMKAYMDDVHFERGGSEVHMRKRARTTSHS